jgi:CRP-like cAMP-binding protein
MMETEEIQSFLCGLPFMLELPESLKQRVGLIFADISDTESIEAGTELFHEGDTQSEDGYIVLSGSVRVEKSYAKSSTAFAPVLLGEVKRFNPSSQRTATVSAREDLDVLHFDWAKFNDAVHARLDKTDQDVLRKALLNYAWLHLLN